MLDSGDTKDNVKLPDTDEGKSIQRRFEAGEQFLVTIIVSLLINQRVYYISN